MKNKKSSPLVPSLRFPEFWEAGEWVEKKLVDIVTPSIRQVTKPESSYLALGIRSHGKGTFHKPDQAPEKNSMDKLYLVHQDDLIVNITFAWERAIAIVGKQDHLSYVSHRFPTYIFKEKVSTSSFFRYVIIDRVFIYKLGLISPGGAGRNRVMNKKDFLQLTVLLPKIEEQQKIAACLSSLDELITAHSQKLDALKKHKKGLMQQLFPAEGQTVPSLRFPEFREAGEWVEKSLGELVEVIDGDRGKNYPKIDEFYKSEYCLFLNAKNVTKNGFKFEENQFIKKEKDAILRKGKLQREDIILTTRGSVGQFAYFSQNIPYDNIRINSGMVILRVKTEKIKPNYLYIFSKSEVLGVCIENTAFGNAQQQLTVAEIKKFKIYFPSLPEQQKIAACLSSLDDLITAQSQKLDALKKHKKGLMQRLFPVVEEE
ncbi:restriction endonuclease subunit S [Thioflexithrix psekupsensis]|uniref:Type I restriction modification DNA specificity domain-containing protein n=1 Tax=Thioflexithrix psekupsensis TaxID=1570016 RepID=A0A251X3Y1_9GAMM|nr:restriction endonuclease subunit S [Thioflexithrix psekupsensis]OUD12096.1 hypothetical protein TPSD3_13290 [Thioflexithrix psekupsensis]